VNKPGSARPSRRRPRAREDLRFQSAPGGLALRDGHGPRSGPLSLTAALVLTYCDGQHDTGAIAAAVARATGSEHDAAAVSADVQRILRSFASEGILA
jgi:hypothetical protein